MTKLIKTLLRLLWKKMGENSDFIAIGVGIVLFLLGVVTLMCGKFYIDHTFLYIFFGWLLTPILIITSLIIIITGIMNFFE